MKKLRSIWIIKIGAMSIEYIIKYKNDINIFLTHLCLASHKWDGSFETLLKLQFSAQRVTKAPI